MAVCNENGVYQPDDRLVLPNPSKGWRGMGLAEITLANLSSYWIWATSFQLMTGDCWGSGSPLSDYPNSGSRAPSREAAIADAATHLRDRLAGRTCRDAIAILKWLDSLTPDQLDLFGAAA